MTLKDADIDAIRKSIPGRYRAEGDGGWLPEQFHSVGSLREPTALQGSADRDAVGDVDRQARLDEVVRHNLGMAFVAGDSDQAAPGFILNGAHSAAQRQTEAKARRDRRAGDRAVLDQVLAALDARLAELDAELAAIDRRLDEIRLRRTEIGESLEALDELTRLKAAGQLDPTDPAHARLLQVAGVDADELEDGGIERRRRELGVEDDALETEWNTRMKRRGQVMREREAVMEARNELEAADSEEAILHAQRRAQTVLGAQQLTEAVHQIGLQNVKLATGKAVAESEAADIRDSSVAYVQRAAASPDQTLTTTTDQFDWDEEPAAPPDEADRPASKPLTPPGL